MSDYDNITDPQALAVKNELEALKTRVAALEKFHNISTPPTTPTPPPTSSYTPNNSGGSGAILGNYRKLSYSSGGVSSQYHLDTKHIDTSKPVGILIHLHGDGAEEFNRPDSTTVNAYRQVAIDNNFIFVLPRTPDNYGTPTWWESGSSATWVVALFNHVAKIRHNVDLNRVYWSGYSGGAEVLTYNILSDSSDLWTGGGAQMLGGGGAYSGIPVKKPSTGLKAHFPLKWVVGSLDDGSSSSDGFDAISAANSGKKYYSSAGYTTSLVTIPNENHYQSENNGPGELRSFISSTLWK